MRLRRPGGADMIASLILIVLGIVTVWEASAYKIGSAGQMGPGYYPILLGIILIALSFAIFLTGCFEPRVGSGGNIVRSDPKFRISSAINIILHPLVIIPVSISVFALLLERGGLVPACIALVLVSLFAAPQVTLRRTIFLILAVPLLSYLIFVAGLGLPFRIVVGWN